MEDNIKLFRCLDCSRMHVITKPKKCDALLPGRVCNSTNIEEGRWDCTEDGWGSWYWIPKNKENP